jgi:hypothetical protein
MSKLNTNINFILFLVDFSKRGEYELRVSKFTLCFFECYLPIQNPSQSVLNLEFCKSDFECTPKEVNLDEVL